MWIMLETKNGKVLVKSSDILVVYDSRDGGGRLRTEVEMAHNTYYVEDSAEAIFKKLTGEGYAL